MMKREINKRSALFAGTAFFAVLLALTAPLVGQDDNSGNNNAEAQPTAVVSDGNATADAAPTADAQADEKSVDDAQTAADVSAEIAGPETLDLQITESDITVTKQETPQKFDAGSFLVFGTLLAIFLVSYFLASFFAKTWRMQEYKNRYFIILFSFLLALFSTVYGLLGHRMNLGIDLRGGSILIYGVSQKVSENATDAERASAIGKGIDAQTMDDLKRVLAERINQGGVREIQIQELGGNEEIKVTIPEADEAEVARIERKINEAGQLKFRILASTQSPEEKELINIAQRPDFAKLHEIRLSEPIGKDKIIIGGTWVPIDATMMEDIQSGIMSDIVIREAPEQPDQAQAEGGQKVYEALVLDLIDLYDVYGKHMARVEKSVGSKGEPVLDFVMNRDGKERMKHLTDRYKKGAERTHGRPLGIILNDSLYSAPSIDSKIEDRGQITFSKNLSADSLQRINRDVDDLLKVMKSGVLPAQLTDEPVTRMLTGPTLGEDTIQRGENSILWGGILVLAFMIAYYGFGGVIASFAVFMNLLLIMMIMLSLRAAFTLDGLAGLVLTVGMAVDANVLIFERIKDELAGGATLKMAIRNGFARAFSAIFDSNITTMLTAIILYSVGSEQIKGFAVTLFLGVLFSLFTATYVSRIIFETAERRGWISNRCVYPIFPGLKAFGKTNIPFMNYAKTAITFSFVAILIGMAAVFMRGKGIFDIDFVGGVQIQAIFNEPKQIGEIRSKLSRLPDLSVSNLSLSKDRSGKPVPENCCFSISTSCPPNMESEEYRGQVEEILHEAFGDSLVLSQFETANIRPEEIPIPGSVTGETTKGIAADITVDPPLAREVVSGYFSDRQKGFLEKKVLEELKFDVTADGYGPENKDNARTDWRVFLETEDQGLAEEFIQLVTSEVNDKPIFESSQMIGSSVAGYARMQGIFAIIGSLICIIIYIGVRFKRLVFGFSATIALIHDVMIVLGVIALSKWLAPYLGFAGINEFKIGLSTVAAFLTLIGYSLNDTIILFDRIREVCGKNATINPEVVNKSINQTLSRTILTSLTTLFVTLVLYFFGGGGIHTFAFAISLGIIVGTYSSIFVASPCLLWLLKAETKKRK